MKLLVTGAGGFVGAAAVREALAAGHDVVGTIRPGGDATRLEALDARLQIAELDMRQSDGVYALMTQARPEIIVHAAWSGVSNRARLDRSQISDNIDASCQLLEAGIAAGARKFVGIGSQGEYGPLSGKIGEGDLPEPSTLYGAAKLAALHLTRQLCAQAGLSFAWLRLFSTYGPGDNPNWLIPAMIEQMLRGDRPKTTLGTQRWDYLHIDDVARGILAAAVTPDAEGVFNLGSGQPVPVREIIEAIRDAVAPDIELVFGEVPFRDDQIWHMEADIARLRAATGWSPQVELGAGLAETVAWHVERRRRDAATSAGAPDA